MRIVHVHVNRGFARSKVDGRQIIAHFIRVVTAVELVAQSKLTYVVISPALEATIIQNGANMVAPSRDFHRCFSSTEVYRRQIIAHITRSRAARYVRALPQLPILIASPTFGGPIIEDDARNITSNGERHRCLASPEFHCRQIIAHFVRCVSKGECIGNTECAIHVSSPTFYGTALKQGTSVIRASADLDGGLSCTKIDERKVITHFAPIVAAINHISETQFAILVVSPALDTSSIEDDASVGVACGDLLYRSTSAEGQRRQVTSHFIGIVTAAVRIAQAEVPKRIYAPAFGGIIGPSGANKTAQTGNSDDRSIEGAGDSITGITEFAGARPRSNRIRAGGIDVTSAVVRLAFVDVRTGKTIPSKTGIAFAKP